MISVVFLLLRIVWWSWGPIKGAWSSEGVVSWIREDYVS